MYSPHQGIVLHRRAIYVLDKAAGKRYAVKTIRREVICIGPNRQWSLDGERVGRKVEALRWLSSMEIRQPVGSFVEKRLGTCR